METAVQQQPSTSCKYRPGGGGGEAAGSLGVRCPVACPARCGPGPGPWLRTYCARLASGWVGRGQMKNKIPCVVHNRGGAAWRVGGEPKTRHRCGGRPTEEGRKGRTRKGGGDQKKRAAHPPKSITCLVPPALVLSS